jgi:hypothetical protein
MTKCLMALAIWMASAAPGFGYALTSEADASRCELYVDSFGIGQLRYMATTQNFLDAYLRVNERELVDLQGDEVLAVGAAMGVRSFSAHGKDGGGDKPVIDVLEFSEKVFASRIAPGSYQLRFAYEERAEPQVYFKEVRNFAFFVDLRRSTGRIDRLWLRNRGSAYTVGGVFGDKPGTEMSIGIGAIRYPDADSAVYQQKVACAR